MSGSGATKWQAFMAWTSARNLTAVEWNGAEVTFRHASGLNITYNSRAYPNAFRMLLDVSRWARLINPTPNGDKP